MKSELPKKEKRGSGTAKATAKKKVKIKGKRQRQREKEAKTLMQNMTDLNIMADKLKIGIFGGAFNPVHNGHLNLAKHYLDELGLDKILFIPTNIPPHKSNEDFAGRKDRFNMLRLAIKPYDKFEVSDIEFKRDGKSYTYDTLLELKKYIKMQSFTL